MKYQKFTETGFKVKGIRKFEFVANTSNTMEMSSIGSNILS